MTPFVFLTIVNDAVRDVFSIRNPCLVRLTEPVKRREEEIHLGVEAHFLQTAMPLLINFLTNSSSRCNHLRSFFGNPLSPSQGDHINLESDVLHGFEHIRKILQSTLFPASKKH